MKDNKLRLAAAVLAVCLLPACGKSDTLPDMTAEERRQIINYSVNVLADHNAGRQDTLKELNDLDLQEIVRRENPSAVPRTPAPAETASPEEENGGMPAPEDEEDLSSGSEGEGQDGGEPYSGSGSAASMEELAGLIGLNGFSISYEGHDIVDSYPPAGADGSLFFSINPASSGDRLLVLNFSVKNTGSSPALCDILSLSPRFRFALNGRMHSFQTTLLMDDLATLSTEIPEGGSEHAVLVAEVSREKLSELSELVLILQGEEGDTQIRL